jgi:photosystem II stability/assembly factor-like uncharacterized protein
MLLALCGILASSTAGAAASQPGGAWRMADSGTSEPLYAVSCLTASRCFAVGAGGTIRSTADGGTTWRTQASPVQGTATVLYRIACEAPSTCYVIARPGTVLVTHDDGATWQAHPVHLTASGAGLTDRACLSENQPGLSGRFGFCQLGLLDISCVSASICSVVATTSTGYTTAGMTAPPSTGPVPNAIWLTTDGGAQWERQMVPSAVACSEGECDPPYYYYPLTWISCLGSGPCRAGGQFFCGPQCGWAYAVLATAGPGQLWKPLSCPASSLSCFMFSPDAGTCPTSRLCYGVANSSPSDPGDQVYRSTDGGTQWLGGSSGSSSVRNGIACPSALVCYTVGDRGSITETANGTSYRAQASPASQDLFGITCVDARICYAVGAGGVILTRR